MTTIKMPDKLKELLKLQGATGETVGIIEDYYSGVLRVVSEEYESGKPKKEVAKPQSIREMAANARIIK